MRLLLGCHIREWSFNYKAETLVKQLTQQSQLIRHHCHTLSWRALYCQALLCLLTSRCLYLQYPFSTVRFLLCYCVFSCASLVRLTLAAQLRKACGLDGLSTHTGHLFHSACLKPSLFAQIKPRHWLGTFAGSTWGHFIIQGSGACPLPTDGVMPSQHDVMSTPGTSWQWSKSPGSRKWWYRNMQW